MLHAGTEISNALETLGYWIVDAERMDDRLAAASNFQALPARLRTMLGELKKRWAGEMARVRR